MIQLFNNFAFFLFGFFTAVMVGFALMIKKKEDIRKKVLKKLKGEEDG